MKRILLVDDDVGMLSLMARGLAHYSLSLAYCGAEALVAAERVGRLDLLITDFMMPSIAGDELIARLRERQPDLKVLVVTGHAAILADADLPWWNSEPYLGKPFALEDLRHAVTELIGPA